MKPVPSPRRTLPGAWLRVAPRGSAAPDWMAVMCTTAGLTRATTSAKDGGPGPARGLAPPATGSAPPPPTRTPSKPAMVATSANDNTRTGRGISGQLYRRALSARFPAPAPTSDPRGSLRAQGDHGIDLRRAARGDVAGEE